MTKRNHSFSFFISALIVLSLICTIPSSVAARKRKPQLHKKRPGETTSRIHRPRVRLLSRDPYLGAIAIDASTGKVLFEDNADASGYPASMVKMMNLLIILEAVEAHQISLQDKVTITAESARIGGSQVYLKENEVHTVNDLLYALTVQSANDAATALAIYYGGSKEAFVAIMNKRARELAMIDTVFHSVHGLPPGRGQLPDVSTPRDITKLCRELLKHPGVLKYTSTKVRLFREDAPEPFIMRNHNHLVGEFEGCDGLKTGFFSAAGFSIAATAANDRGRAIAVILGSAYSKVRDKKARELLASGLAKISAGLSPPSVEVSMDKPGGINLSFLNPFTWESPYLIVLVMCCGFYALRKLKNNGQ